jgi:hypothetical protein
MKINVRLKNEPRMTRFKLEDALMRLWGTAEDVETLFQYYYERHDSINPEDVANALLGIKQMIQMRGELAFELFERLIKEQAENENT